jgi:hypothetical protein
MKFIPNILTQPFNAICSFYNWLFNNDAHKIFKGFKNKTMSEDKKICRCCQRNDRIDDLRFGVCFDCATAESIIDEGVDMYDQPVEKKEGMSMPLSKVHAILKLYNIK